MFESTLPRTRLRRRALRAVAVAALTTAMLAVPASAGASTWYTSTTGSDAAAGSKDKPFATVGRGLAALRSGDTLYVRGGSYAEVVNRAMPSCTATAPCAVRAYPGERPVVRGLLWLRGGNAWTVDGLGVTWDSARRRSEHMMKVTGGTNWTLRGMEIWGARSYAGLLVAGAPANWRVTGSCIHDTYPANGLGQDHNIYANTGLSAGPGRIDHNLLFNAVNGLNLKLAGSSPGEGSANVMADHNTMYNALQNVLVGWASRNNVLERNIAVKSPLRNYRGYELTGSNNVVRNSLGGLAPALLVSDAGYIPLASSGNVSGVDPRFDKVGCHGFHPQNPLAQKYGAFAP
jgi:hypothetical protein